MMEWLGYIVLGLIVAVGAVMLFGVFPTAYRATKESKDRKKP